MYNVEKTKEILSKYKMLERDDASEIIEAFNEADESESEKIDYETKLKENNDMWAARFKEAFFSPKSSEPSETETSVETETEETENYTYDSLFTEKKDEE